jgi:hypothetical protein
MDIERAVEFMVQQQARTEVQLQAIKDLLQGGIKLVTSYQGETNRRLDALLDGQLRSEEKIAKLADAQLKLATAQEATERRLQALIESLTKTNGQQ